MRTLMRVTLWMKPLAIIAGVICSLFGFSFFYFGPEPYPRKVDINEWLFPCWMLSVVGLMFIFKRAVDHRRFMGLLFCWDISVAPLMLALISFIESLMTSDSIQASSYRTGCMIILFVGFLVESRFYYVNSKHFKNA